MLVLSCVCVFQLSCHLCVLLCVVLFWVGFVCVVHCCICKCLIGVFSLVVLFTGTSVFGILVCRISCLDDSVGIVKL